MAGATALVIALQASIQHSGTALSAEHTQKPVPQKAQGTEHEDCTTNGRQPHPSVVVQSGETGLPNAALDYHLQRSLAFLTSAYLHEAVVDRASHLQSQMQMLLLK